jgi:hypothetical protein
LPMSADVSTPTAFRVNRTGMLKAFHLRGFKIKETDP